MTTLPDALLFIAPGCAHCPVVEQGLNELAAQGLIGKLTVLDVTAHSELAAEYGIRAAPWLRLGPFTLTGVHSPAELKQIAAWANDPQGAAHYIEYLLKRGNYPQAKSFIAADTHRLKPLLAIVADPGARLEVRLGVNALLESHADTPALQRLLPQLVDLTRHADHRVRADACHLLSLTGDQTARNLLQNCLEDAHEEVREIAAEAISELDKLRPC